MKYIELDKAIGAVEGAFKFEVETPANYRDIAIETLKLLPAADVAEVRHGRNLDAEYSSLFECSVCHWSCWDTLCGDTPTYNYCPNCGAKMDEVTE